VEEMHRQAGGSDLRPLLSVAEFARATGMAPATVRQRVWLRQIEFVRLGRSIRFRPETAEKLIREGTVPPLPEKSL
jgi:hypothetical protein